jgi:putative ABC transport system permease protein
MRSVLLQTLAVLKMNLKSVPQRFWISFSTVLAIALAVMVLLAFLAMADGFQQTLISSGGNDVAVLLREGARAEISSVISREQVHLLQEAPGIAKGADGEPLVSAELYVVVDGIKRASQTKANVPLRGIGSEGGVLRKGITLIGGRMFHHGTNEIVVGRAMMREFQGFEVGQTVTFGRTTWNIVGLVYGPPHCLHSGGGLFISAGTSRQFVIVYASQHVAPSTG